MKIKAVYTFGAPRVLSPEAADYAEGRLLRERIFRHVRSGDLIPEVPSKYHGPEGRPPREVFDHAGLIAWIDDQGTLAFGPGPWLRAKERLETVPAILDSRAPSAMAAHRMGRYHAPVYEQYRESAVPRPNGWDPAVALACARAAQLAYQGPVRQVLPLLGFARARLVVGVGLEVLVVVPLPAEQSSYGIVAFRGAQPVDLDRLDRWRTAVEAWQSHVEAEQEPWFPGAPGSAHAAWLGEVVEIEPTLQDAVRRICGGRSIVVTGHGKGGAQAVVWALRSAQEAREGGSARRHRRPGAPKPLLPWKPTARPGEDWRHPLSYVEVGARIRQLRESQGVTQAELARLIEVEQSNFSRMEKGEYRVHLEALLRILAQLDVSLSDFFDEDRRDSLPPGDVLILDELRQLSEDARDAVLSLIRFKRRKKDL